MLITTPPCKSLFLYTAQGVYIPVNSSDSRLRNVFQLIQYLENKDFHKFVVPLVPNLTPRVFPAELLNTGNDFEIANYRPCI